MLSWKMVCGGRTARKGLGFLESEIEWVAASFALRARPKVIDFDWLAFFRLRWDIPRGTTVF